jgi:pre-mRNA-processing factor 40
MEKFRQMLRSIPDIAAETPWKAAQPIFKSHPAYVIDISLQSMDMIDFLTVFEDHVKMLEADYFEAKARERAQQRREERKNRDGVRSLLVKLQQDGAIHSKTQWKDIVQHLTGNVYYESMLGQPGSTPIELFWDLVVDLENKDQSERKKILDAIRVSFTTVINQDVSLMKAISAIGDYCYNGNTI